MASRFADLSIKTKLVVIIQTITTIALVLSGTIFYRFDKSEFKKKTVRDLSILAQVIADNNTANLTFNGHDEARESLNTLVADNHINQAILYKSGSKAPFAVYIKNKSGAIELPFPVIFKDTVLFENNSLIISKKINLDKEVLGSIYIHYSLNEYEERVSNLILVLAIILLSSNLIVFFITLRLQKVVSNPIKSLAILMRKISEEKNYSLRALNTTNDEIGILSGGFNQMLSTIEDQNKDLNMAKVYAEKSLKVKEQFLANMSHEIRTPMNAIMGMTNLLLDTALNKDQYIYLDSIKVSSENLLVIINDILDYSKIEAGKIELENREFNLHDLINRFNNTLKFSIERKNLFLNIKIDQNVPKYVKGDEVRLNQILLNLSGNAIKFTEKGGITIFVNVINETGNVISIQFSVIDTGIGIPKDKLETIFESFSQASSETTRKYGGTGLGLTISKQLVELQGGRISVTSEEDKGSSFSFYVNYQKAVSIPKPTEEFVKTKKIIDKYNQQEKLKRITVLLVEDNKLNQLMTSTLLKQNQIDIEIADNGKIALEKLKKFDYDLILMDLHMPEMDGYNATQIIRSQFEGTKKNIPIIALTAAVTKSEIEKCKAIGMTDIVSKPYKPNILLEKIIKYSIKQE